MSSSFDVFPGTVQVPTFGDVLSHADAYLGRYLESNGITGRPHLQAELRVNYYGEWAKDSWRATSHGTAEGKAPFIWNLDSSANAVEYAWFYIPNVPGGTDALFEESAPEQWQDELLAAPQGRRHHVLITTCMQVPYMWSFRMASGQRSATMQVAYGCIAAAIADLTHGLIYSNDGAWDKEDLPSIASDFLAWYLQPEVRSHTEQNWKTMTEYVHQNIQNELRGAVREEQQE